MTDGPKSFAVQHWNVQDIGLQYMATLGDEAEHCYSTGQTGADDDNNYCTSYIRNSITPHDCACVSSIRAILYSCQ